MSRFVLMEAVSIDKSKNVTFYDFYLNPFQIESFYESEVSYDRDDTLETETKECCTLRTKSGAVHTVLLNTEEMKSIIEC
jgi:hypothetical protein